VEEEEYGESNFLLEEGSSIRRPGAPSERFPFISEGNKQYFAENLPITKQTKQTKQQRIRQPHILGY
jgi:hypothetical protein